MFNLFKRTNVSNMSAAELESRLAKDSTAVLVDVRTKKEFDSGHIPGALHINLQSREFMSQIKSLDKKSTYLVYCRSGQRSMVACKIMQKAGIDSTINLKGGILSWQKQNIPI